MVCVGGDDGWFLEIAQHHFWSFFLSFDLGAFSLKCQLWPFFHHKFGMDQDQDLDNINFNDKTGTRSIWHQQTLAY